MTTNNNPPQPADVAAVPDRCPYCGAEAMPYDKDYFIVNHRVPCYWVGLKFQPQYIHVSNVATWTYRATQPATTPSSADVRTEIAQRLALARSEKENAERSGYDKDALRLDGAVGVLENLLEDIDIGLPAPPDITERARRAAEKVAAWAGGDGRPDGNAISEIAEIIVAEFGREGRRRKGGNDESKT
jgi:hypothetical protein